MYRAHIRALNHLKTLAEALREVVTKGKEFSIKRQIKYITSAHKEYFRVRQKVGKENKGLIED
jgi:hypothetical protein